MECSSGPIGVNWVWTWRVRLDLSVLSSRPGGRSWFP